MNQTTRNMILASRVARAYLHGWNVCEYGARGVYMSRVGKDGKVYAAYITA